VRQLATVVFALLIQLALSPKCLAQDAVPAGILNRTIFIKGPTEAGTAFSVDYKGKLYLVTARHVIAGVPAQNATIQMWRDEHWKDYHTVRTLFPSSENVDIAVFETNEKVETPYPVTVSGPPAVAMGQQVWFLGYPFGISSHFKGGTIAPFIKRGTMSAIDATNPDAVVIYIDGFNNPGFSGGPIVFFDFSKHEYAILGVVKGYKEDSAKVLINGQHVDTQLLVNTGILVAYSIEHAMKAIEASQK
jgi:S1-C subfamily serine protease